MKTNASVSDFFGGGLRPSVARAGCDDHDDGHSHDPRSYSYLGAVSALRGRPGNASWYPFRPYDLPGCLAERGAHRHVAVVSAHGQLARRPDFEMVTVFCHVYTVYRRQQDRKHWAHGARG
jgi:hypothetical protein